MSPDATARALQECAAIVIGNNVTKPDWLDYRLAQNCARISVMRDAEEGAPKRKDVRARLDEFARAVLVIKEGVSDHRFNTFLGHDWVSAGASYAQVIASLDELSRRAHDASLTLSGRGGRGEAFPTKADEAISAQQYCAWTIRHAIRLSRSYAGQVGPDNPDALLSANMLWKAAGGIPLGTNGKEPTGWREHFIEIGNAEAAGDRRSAWLKIELELFAIKPLVEIEATD